MKNSKKKEKNIYILKHIYILADVGTWGTILPPSLMVATQGKRDYLFSFTEDFADKNDINWELTQWIDWGFILFDYFFQIFFSSHLPNHDVA